MPPSSPCIFCKTPMNETDRCMPRMIDFADGTVYPAVAHQSFRSCRICGVAPGFHHHPGCSRERCPRCGRLILLCSCPMAIADTWTEVRYYVAGVNGVEVVVLPTGPTVGHQIAARREAYREARRKNPHIGNWLQIQAEYKQDPSAVSTGD